MDRATKEKTLRLLGEKQDSGDVTHSDIALEIGCSKRQLIRLSKRLADEDPMPSARTATAAPGRTTRLAGTSSTPCASSAPCSLSPRPTSTR